MDQVRATQEEKNRILFALKDATVKLRSDARLDDRFWVGSESDADFKDRVYAYSWGTRRGLMDVSRFDAAPLIAFIAAKETNYAPPGRVMRSMIPRGD